MPTLTHPFLLPIKRSTNSPFPTRTTYSLSTWFRNMGTLSLYVTFRINIEGKYSLQTCNCHMITL